MLIDKLGLFYKIEDDGSKGYGDSCAETMRYWHLKYFRYFVGIDPQLSEDDWKVLQSEFANVSTKFFHNKTEYNLVRAPVGLLPREWGDPVKDLPGDQQDPFVMASGAWHCQFNVIGIYEAQQKRFLYRYQNGDLPKPNTGNIFRRALVQKPSLLGDLGLWGTVLTRCGKLPFWDSGLKRVMFGNPNDVADDLNLVHSFMQCYYAGQTKASISAKAYYIKNRIKSFGSYPKDQVVIRNPDGSPKEYGLGIEDRILGAIAWYYRKDSPGLVELYKPVLHYLFSGAK